MTLRILVMGGTRFIGRHFVQSAVRRGHSVTLFHRGRTGAGLFPECINFIGDRDHDLSLLEKDSWDATVDLSAYLPRQVHALGEVLKRRSGLYVLVSSTAVYAASQTFGFDEDSRLATLVDPACGEVTDKTYGGLKVLCEQAAEIMFSNVLIVRPTYVVGPFDYTGRFTYWVERIAMGGEVLAPGPQDTFFQLIDVRDLASWITNLLEQHVEGIFHAANPFPPVTFAQLLGIIAQAVAPAGTRFTWVDRSFLIEAEVDARSLPLWPGANPEGVLEAANPARARSAGLVTRPLVDTIRELYVHEAQSPTSVEGPLGLTAARETSLLKAWRQQLR
jgi:2'-hydroxyisoflavone reductase